MGDDEQHARGKRPDRLCRRLDDARDHGCRRQLDRIADEQRHQRPPRRVRHRPGDRDRPREGQQHRSRSSDRGEDRRAACHDGSQRVNHGHEPLAVEALAGARQQGSDDGRREHLRRDQEGDGARPARPIGDDAERDGRDRLACIGTCPRGLETAECGPGRDCAKRPEPTHRLRDRALRHDSVEPRTLYGDEVVNDLIQAVRCARASS